MSEDEANRMLYEARLKAQRDEYSRVHGAWQDGWQKGRKERDIAIAKSALA
jgi:allantoicase